MQTRTGEWTRLDASPEEVAMNEWLDEAGLYLAMPENVDAGGTEDEDSD